MLLFPLNSKLEIFVFILNIIMTFVIIFLERKSPKSTYAWLLFLWIIPILGFVFYLFLSQNLTRRKIYRYDTPEEEEYQKMMLGKSLIHFGPDDDTQKQLFHQYHNNIDYNINTCEAFFTNNNGIDIYTDGHAKFEALFKAIEGAKSSIHLEYYIIKYDDLGRRLLTLLTRKAAEGVEVRLLYDEMGGRYIPRRKLKEFARAGGEYGAFFPTKFRVVNLRVNYRDHRKIAVIDGRTAFIGGYNIGDEYLGKNPKMGYWRDTHLRISGYAVYELQRRFFLDWRTSDNIDPIDLDPGCIGRYYPDMPKFCGAGIQIVSSGPDDPNQVIKQDFLRMITNAKEHIYIQSPYFVPDESVLESLKIAILSGVDVRIMIPDKPDHIFIYWATLAYVGELVEYGAKIYIYENGFLHAKTITVDDEICAVGSCNFDIRSFSLNFESNAFVYDQSTATALRHIFHKDIEKSQLYDLETYRSRPRRIKIKESISRLFAPLL
ncbi:cardiolipin synthase [Eubacterium aggregans]|uniref:Cardiolipin synthase n=1 Tax=Eubacterium aggregans TaxID=81409 RepID=A0A1H4A618_9FIRM|nr:cardiolipin synthase [Eubacterium aggregans]SEA31340.1 cardiolipin synthase [Eubacterium aggregans]